MARGRRPTEEVRRDVLAAAGRLLLRDGMTGFTIEKVATESGASKVTIYKLWPSKGALALEGYFTVVEPVLEFPHTEDLADDLRGQLHAFVALLTTTPAGAVVRGLIAEAQHDAALMQAYRERYSAPRRQLAVDRIEAGRDAGQVRAGVDAQVVVDQLWGACYHRLLIPDEPLDTDFADRLLDQLLRGIAA